MLEARLSHAATLKKLLDAIKELVSDCNLDCNDTGIALQAMDNSHVALVSMLLRAEGFDPYRCDRNVALGINLNSFAKVLRSAQNDDIITIKAEDTPDTLNLVFESAKQERMSEYDVKLMDIDSEHMGIPDTEYDATVTLPAAEFQRICRDLVGLSESVTIEVSKGSIKFSCQGDIGNGQVTLKPYDDPENPSNNVSIELSQGVTLSFSLKYLVNFTKATPLSGSVTLRLLESMPILVEYNMEGVGHLHFFLAPKSTDED